MPNLVHVCLYNTDPKATEELTKHISGLTFVRLIGEATSPTDLANVLSGPNLHILFFHLDPAPADVLELIDQVATRHPEVALIAISGDRRPDAILAPMRAGCEQFICKPIDQADLVSAVGRVSAKRLLVRRRSRSICVMGSSGGAGSTTIACNLALEIGHQTERPCALVDLDLQFGDVAMNFDMEPKYSFYDLAEALDGMDAQVLNSTLSTMTCNVSFLPRPDRVEQAEYVTADVVHRAIDLLGTSFENVIIDVPRRIDGCTMAALGQADLILVVCQLLVPSTRNAKRLVDALRGSGIPDERIELVVNRYESGNNGRVNTKDVEELIKPVFATVPNDYQFVARSLDFGRPIAAIDRNNAVRKALRGIAKKLITDVEAEQPATGAKRGLLDRLLR